MPAYDLSDADLLAACTVAAMRSSGPGGQHANRTASAVRLVHGATGATAQCQDHRERGRNQAEALRRLRIRLAATERGGADPAWLVPHRRGGRLHLGPGAQDYPRVAAALLDSLAAASGSLAAAAEACAISTTNCAATLAADPDIRAAADLLRAAHGLGPLRVR